MCPIPKVVSIKIHTSTSISLSPIKTLPYVFSPGPIHPGSHFLVIFKGAKMGFMNMYTYYISHFFFTRDKVECYYTLLSHFYVVLVCRRAGPSDILLPRLWSGLTARTRLVGDPGTIGLSLINNWSVGLIL